MEIIKQIKRPWYRFWLTKEEKEQKLFNRGFAFVSSSLLNGISVEEIQRSVDCSKASGDYNHFDAGADAALVKWSLLK